jgi:hypothetical protein
MRKTPCFDQREFYAFRSSLIKYGYKLADMEGEPIVSGLVNQKENHVDLGR